MKRSLGYEDMPKEYVRPVRCISAYDFDFDVTLDLDHFNLDDPFSSRVFRWFFKDVCAVHREQVLVWHDVKYIAFVMLDYNLRTSILKCKLLFCSYWPTIHKLHQHGLDAESLVVFPASYACKDMKI